MKKSAVKYADCISAEGKTPPKECPRNDTIRSEGEAPV